MKNQNNDTYSLAHTTWKCQYHIVFTPKYHRKIIYEVLRKEIGKILRELCQRKGVEIIEAHTMPDHMKYKVGNRHFWSRGYYVSTVGGNKQAVQKYIQHQETEDLISNQISMVEYYDPFKKWLESNQNKKK